MSTAAARSDGPFAFREAGVIGRFVTKHTKVFTKNSKARRSAQALFVPFVNSFVPFVLNQQVSKPAWPG